MEPEKKEAPLLGDSLIKHSKSVMESLVSYHIPIRKVSFSFHKSQSGTNLEETKQTQQPKETKLQTLKSKSDTTFQQIDPFDHNILQYLSSFVEYIILIRQKEEEIKARISERAIVVPSVSEKRIIIFDLDDTLVYNFDTEENCISSFMVRPHCKSVLAELSKCYDVWIWTAGSEEHCNRIRELIDP